MSQILVLQRTPTGIAAHDCANVREATILFAMPGETVAIEESRAVAAQLRRSGSVEFRDGVTLQLMQ
jgi:hypothetical protein